MQNHGTQHPTSPMPITKQRKPSFSYLSIVSNWCYNFEIFDCIPHIRSPCRILSDEARLGRGLSRYLTQRFFPLHISQVRFLLSSHENFWCLPSLQIDPRSVDVNVHPTKREVHFLNEEAITERIADALQQSLAKQNHSRVFEYQVSYIMDTFFSKYVIDWATL